jgi:hypothetical protein
MAFLLTFLTSVGSPARRCGLSNGSAALIVKTPPAWDCSVTSDTAGGARGCDVDGAPNQVRQCCWRAARGCGGRSAS